MVRSRFSRRFLLGMAKAGNTVRRRRAISARHSASGATPVAVNGGPCGH